MDSIHKPVLLKKSIELLNVKSGIYVDCTLGGGGHTLKIKEELRIKNEKGKIVCFDVDKEAIKRFEEYLVKNSWSKINSSFKKNKVEIILVNKNFEKLEETLVKLKIKRVDGIIADLGVSSDQLEDTKRGFSYSEDAPLDMRMDKRLEVKASDLVNGLYEKELANLFKGQDEVFAKRIARAIVEERTKKPIKTTLHLVNIIKEALPRKGKIYANKGTFRQLSRRKEPYWKKPVMRVFQALRIQVNSELSSLQNLLPQAFEALATGSRFVIISFHSGEDRIVKSFFKEKERLGEAKILTKKPVRPSASEVRENSRARSARLRALEKQ
jgi:16S rRNA (cytosine1402-N4)-methyltransferase